MWISTFCAHITLKFVQASGCSSNSDRTFSYLRFLVRYSDSCISESDWKYVCIFETFFTYTKWCFHFSCIGSLLAPSLLGRYVGFVVQLCDNYSYVMSVFSCFLVIYYLILLKFQTFMKYTYLYFIIIKGLALARHCQSNMEL